MKRILSYLKPYIKEFTLSQFLMILATISGLLFPWFIKNFFDNLIQNTGYQNLLTLVCVLLGLFLISHIANYFKDISLGILGEKIVKDIRSDVYEKLNKLPSGFYARQKSGDIVSRLTNDINLFQMSLSTGLSYLLRQFISLSFILIMLLKLDPILTLIVFSMFPLLLLISRKMGSKVKEVTKNLQQRLGDLTSFTNESITGIHVIKTFVLEKTVNRMYRDENERIFKHSVRNIKIKAKASLAIGLLTSLQLLALIGVGGYRVFNGYMGTGDLIAFLLYVEMIIGPISMLSNLYMDVQKSLAAIARVFEILSTDDEIKDKEGARELDRTAGSIEFKNVYFSYGENIPVLRNTSLSIHTGEKVALVGSSGAGKSTIINLIPRFYDVNDGSILIDGINIKDISVASLRKNIAIVPQDTMLFGISIRDNILCGNPNADLDQVLEAAKKANAHEFIESFKEGYDTIVGERGSTLSGGQRQRIAIARAFLKDPAILLLDEATSSLDAFAETKVIQALNELMKGRTTITIAHKLSTVIDFDRIYVIEGGRIIAEGTHNQLLETCSFYRKLFEHNHLQPCAVS